MYLGYIGHFSLFSPAHIVPVRRTIRRNAIIYLYTSLSLVVALYISSRVGALELGKENAQQKPGCLCCQECWEAPALGTIPLLSVDSLK